MAGSWLNSIDRDLTVPFIYFWVCNLGGKISLILIN